MAKRTSGRRAGLAAISIRALHGELKRRERQLRTLQRRREKLVAKLTALDSHIGDAGGFIARANSLAGIGPRRRPHNEMNLVDSLARTLKGKTMSVMEAADAVQKAGYKTTSATFRTIVNQTLIKSDKFKKIGRGRYTAA